MTLELHVYTDYTCVTLKIWTNGSKAFWSLWISLTRRRADFSVSGKILVKVATIYSREFYAFEESRVWESSSNYYYVMEPPYVAIGLPC